MRQIISILPTVSYKLSSYLTISFSIGANAYLRLEDWSLALEDSEKSIELNKEYGKVSKSIFNSNLILIVMVS